MNRNMKEAHRKIFERLKNYAEKSGRSVSCYGIGYERRVNLDKESQEWLKRLEITVKQSVSPRLKLAFLKYRAKLYFVATSFDLSDSDLDIIDSKIQEYSLNRVDQNGGIFTALVSELDIPIKNTIEPSSVLDIFPGFR